MLEKLNNFLPHLQIQNEEIRFTMEIEKNNHLPFLHVLVKQNTVGI